MKTKTVRIKGELKEVEKYEILKPLGEGGIGIVYLARHKELENYVAIKELLETTKLYFEHLLELFEQEAKLTAKLSVHPNIIKVMDILHDEDNRIYIVMEYISREGYDEKGYPLPGYTLDEFIKKGISEKEAIEIFKKICDGVAYAHKMRVIHRDLKPTNILIGQYNQVKISDFGIAKVLKEGAKKSRMSFRIGTYAYMAPEQIEEEVVGYFSDIYSLGIIFYEMLTGRYPYEIKKGTDTEYMDAHRTAPPLLEYIKNPGLKEIIKKCLEKNYEKRYQTIDELLKDLEKAIEIELIIPVKKIKVPSLIGKSKDEGIKLLEELRLNYRIVYSEGQKNRIVAQNIKEGTEIDKDTEIMVFVGKGKQEKKFVKSLLVFIPIIMLSGIIYFVSNIRGKSSKLGYGEPSSEQKITEQYTVITPKKLPGPPPFEVEEKITLKKCPKCGQLYSLNTAYCAFCEENGQPVALIETTLLKNEVKKCPKCGLYFKANVNYCPYCGEENPVRLEEVR
jgi:serine/threonine-protein kinase